MRAAESVALPGPGADLSRAVTCVRGRQLVQSLAGGDPYVFAGDFNVVPGSAPYRLLTTGALAPADPAYPPPPRAGGGGGWSPRLAEGMCSAYAVANGAEPAFTNFAQVAGGTARRAGSPLRCEGLCA